MAPVKSPAKPKAAPPSAAAIPALAAKLDQIRAELNGTLIERREEIDALLLALVARQHVLFVGPPGTAKSKMCNGLAAAIDCKEFSWLMQKFTNPEEIFGMYSLRGLENDQYFRLTTGKMPEAELVFLDEVWKASSAILNAMLQIMNERTFNNGMTTVTTPIRCIVAGSNEWPVGEGYQELGAAFDRFLLRLEVKPVSAASQPDLLFNVFPPVNKVATMADIDAAAAAAELLPFDQTAQDAFMGVIASLKLNGVTDPGDRRLRASVGVCRAAALLDGSPVVLPGHLTCLRHTLWVDPIQRAKVAECVLTVANPDLAQVLALMAQADEILDQCSAVDATKKTEAIEHINKLKSIKTKLSGLSCPEAAEAMKTVGAREIQVRTAVFGC